MKQPDLDEQAVTDAINHTIIRAAWIALQLSSYEEATIHGVESRITVLRTETEIEIIVYVYEEHFEKRFVFEVEKIRYEWIRDALFAELM